jgi:NADPH:quinone reductase-like Zn-dependent oxidoreductase
VAGLTALFALEEGGLLVGRNVLVNGASGGVGHFALQLARDAGARVVAAVRRAELKGEAEADGAHLVVVSEDLAAAEPHGPYDLVLESVGGPALARALTMLRTGGTCVTFGNSARAPATVDVNRFFLQSDVRLFGLYVLERLRREPAGEGLARLLGRVAAGRLKPRITLEASWERVGEVAQRLYRREIAGKAVLHVAGG